MSGKHIELFMVEGVPGGITAAAELRVAQLVAPSRRVPQIGPSPDRD